MPQGFAGRYISLCGRASTLHPTPALCFVAQYAILAASLFDTASPVVAPSLASTGEGVLLFAPYARSRATRTADQCLTIVDARTQPKTLKKENQEYPWGYALEPCLHRPVSPL